MRRIVCFAAIAATILFTTAAYGQSSKFAATYDTDVVLAKAYADGAGAVEGCVTINEVQYCNNEPGDVTTAAEAEVATLKVPQLKEILGQMSAQVSLVTFTQAKNANQAGTTTAIAEGTMRAGMIVLPHGLWVEGSCVRAFNASDAGADIFAAPGPVTFASRAQQLALTVDLDVFGSIPDCDEDCIEENLGIDGSVTAALGLDTTAAHSFQFIADDLVSDEYDVIACYDLSAFAAVDNDAVDLDADTAAFSRVALGPRIITAQEVRATTDGVIDESGDPK